MHNGIQIGMNNVKQGCIYYLNGWDTLLPDANIDLLRISGGGEGDIYYTNMFDNPNNWDVHFDAYLSLIAGKNFKGCVQTLGDPWGAFLGIDGLNVGLDRTPSIVSQNLTSAPSNGWSNYGGKWRYDLCSDSEIASGYPTTKKYLNMLAGNNSLGKNFFQDNRVLYWTLTNEFFIGTPNNPQGTNGDKTYAWWVFVHDFIRSKGGVVAANNLLYGNDGWEQRFPVVASYAVGHADLIEFHDYRNNDTLHGCSANPSQWASLGYYPPTRTWQNWEDEIVATFQSDYLTGNPFGASNTILGEFGLWQGHSHQEGGPWLNNPHYPNKSGDPNYPNRYWCPKCSYISDSPTINAGWDYSADDNTNYVNHYFNALKRVGNFGYVIYFAAVAYTLPNLGQAYGVLKADGTKLAGYNALRNQFNPIPVCPDGQHWDGTKCVPNQTGIVFAGKNWTIRSGSWNTQ